MQDESFIEPIGVAEYFVDGWTDMKAENGLFSCAGYRIHNGRKIAVVRMIMPIVGTPEMQQQARTVLGNSSLPLDEQPPKASASKLRH